YNRSSPFLKVFGRPEGASVCECERVQSSSLAQSLHMMNASDLKGKINNSNGRALRLATESKPAEEKIRELYLVAFSRTPREDEMKTALDYLAEPRLDSLGKPIAAKTAARDN